MRDKGRSVRRTERGSALVYILIAIALLAALTMAFMSPSSNQTTSQNTFKTISEIQSQGDFIRSAVQECVLTYSGGDAGVISFYSGTRAHNYPLMPDDSYLDGCVAKPSQASQLVSDLRCPGNPGDDPCHSTMFGGNTAKFMPPPPALFNAWKYYNGADGVFMWTDTANTDAFIDTVLEKLDAAYSECEADPMTPTSGDFQMTSDMGAAVVCQNDTKCFRIWIKINATATYEPGGEEATAGCP